MSTTTTKTFKMENHVIGFVPRSERHGHPRILFPMWFAINLAVITMVLGSIGVFSGLNLAWSAVAIVLGNGVGAVFMALHSVQGPRIGTPQMIQSRLFSAGSPVATRCQPGGRRPRRHATRRSRWPRRTARCRRSPPLGSRPERTPRACSAATARTRG
jgi:hypothetical protein